MAAIEGDTPDARLGAAVATTAEFFAVGIPGASRVQFGRSASGAASTTLVGPPGTRFGHAIVALADAAGEISWLIAAPDDPPSGAVHRFVFGGDPADPGPQFVETIRPTGLVPGARAGWSLAAAGDWIALGAPWHGPPSSPTGAVALFHRGGGSTTWSAAPVIVPPPGESETGFAEALATDGVHLAIGAPRGTGAASESGCVDLHRLVGTPAPAAPRIARLFDPTGDSGDGAGGALAFGAGAIAIGVPYRDAPNAAGPGGGTVHILSAASIEILPAASPVVPSIPVPVTLARDASTTAAAFGSALAFVDGAWWVGAPADATAAPLAGSVTRFVVDPSSPAGWSEEETLVAASPGLGASFGRSIASAAGRVVVGAPGDPAGCGGAFGCDAGRAEVWVTALGRDCDENGVSDRCQVFLDLALDLDGDGLLDRCAFRRGDAVGDGTLNLADAIAILHALSPLAGEEPGGECPAAWDANADGSIDFADPITLLAHLFIGGPPPPPPVGACAVDATGLPCSTECGP